MSDKILSQIPRNYAKALADTVGDSSDYALYSDQFSQILAVLENSKDLSDILSNEAVSTAKKLEIAEELFKGKIDSKILNLLKILIEKKHISELKNIYKSYKELMDDFSNKKNITVISAIDLNNETKEKITSLLTNKFKSEINTNWYVDNSIIAGLVFKYDDCVIDTSLKAKLDNLGKNILR